MRLAAALTVLSACSPCELHRLPDVPGAAPGEVRHGVRVDEGADVVATPSGIACLTCGAIHELDGSLREQRIIDVDLAGSGALAVGNDTLFVLDSDFGLNPETHGGDYREPHYQLFALSASGDELWRNDLGDGEAWNRGSAVNVLAGSTYVVVYGAPLASVFDPTRGVLLWTTPLARGDAIAPDAVSGLLVARGASVHGPDQPRATLEDVTVDGTLWTTTWTTADASPFSGGTISFMDAASTADGGFVVIGRFDTATLDAGGHLLQASDPSAGPYGVNDTSFVAALDRNGATRWAAVFGKSDAARQFIARRIVPSGDGVMICGNYSGASQPGLPATDGTIDAFVERIDASGAIIAHPISGTGEQICEALAGAADGSATMTLTSFDAPGGGLLRAGSQTFETGPQTEVFVVNLAL